jgi:hypothetical protein
MNKSSHVLFLLRLLLYFSVILLIFVHPGIIVKFDRIGIIQWFLIIPLMAIMAYIPEHKIKTRTRLIISAALLILLSLTAGTSIFIVLQLFAAGIISYALTFLLFNRRTIFEKFSGITSIEPFFLAWVCLRLLSLSRSGEDIAGQSAALTQFIMVWTAVVFLLHSVIIYLCLYPKSRFGIWKECFIFSLGSIAVLVLLMIVMPPDFVRNSIIANLVSERIPQIIRSSERGQPERGNGRRTLPGEGGSGELRGMSESDWANRGEGSGEARQYLVKIVASEREPIYMGDKFMGQLDPVRGFTLSAEEPLNDLARQRFFVTWSDNQRERDKKRRRQYVFSLSTSQHKYLPYRPVSIDPIILNENSGPLRYIHQVMSNTHSGDPLLLVQEATRYFTERERRELAHYLEISLEPNERKIFDDYLSNALNDWRVNKNEIIKSDPYLMYVFNIGEDDKAESKEIGGDEYMEKIIALLTSFSKYQYNINPKDDSSVAALIYFLTDSSEGDCVEFSNVLALLGRLAGIPSRVVTGYLAAESLQQPAHIRGLSVLRSQLPVLQQFPFDHLYMVTNVHAHSWTQFYLPDYGWLDFESTSFSMPPMEMGDFNNWDVVIPMLDKDRTFSNVKKFPWRAALRSLIILAVIALIGAYVLRYGREFILYLGTENGLNYRSRARNLYLLLLARLAADGQPIKPASKTAHEYSELFKNLAANPNQRFGHESSHLKTFADIYSEIRWREFTDQSELEDRFNTLKQEYHNILKTTKQKGLHRWFIRIISLRGLAYL